MARAKQGSKSVSFYITTLVFSFLLVASSAFSALADGASAFGKILGLICTCAFPVLMCTAGAALLGGESADGAGYFFGLLRTFLLLLGGSFLLFLLGGGSFGAVRGFFGEFFSVPMASLYKYVWLFIGFLIMQPFLAKMSGAFSDSKWLLTYIILGALILVVLPLTGILPIRNSLTLPIFSAAVFFPLAGKAIEPYRSSGGSVVAAVISAAGVVASCVMAVYGFGSGQSDSPASVIFTVSVFTLFAFLFDIIRWGAGFTAVFKFLGGAAPSAVIVYVPFMALAARFLPGFAGTAAAGLELLKVSAVYFVSLILVGLIRLIPGADKVI